MEKQKREYLYERSFNYREGRSPSDYPTNDIPVDEEFFSSNLDDTIRSNLAYRLIEITPGNYTLFNGKGFFKISTNTWNFKNHYKRTITIEAMPRGVELPKDLTSLLEGKGFQDVTIPDVIPKSA